MPTLVSVLFALGLCHLAFTLAFRFARRIDNYGVVDVLWSYAFGPVALIFAALADGWAPRRWLVAALALGWSLRLGLYLQRRVGRHHPEEDGRYREMRRRWADDLSAKMAAFYQMQAASVVLLALPFLLAVGRGEPGLTLCDWLGIALFAVGLVGESLADAQLAAFKREPANRGRVCAVGLWGWSRHPNYFFVWLTWCAFALFALPAAWGWLGLLAPATILYLLLRVTGIPPTEEQALRSKGDAYRDYQRRVSAFVPLPPRRG